MDYKKFKIFLTALEQGLEIEVGGYIYAMGFDSNDNPRIAHKIKKVSSEGKEEFVLMQGLVLPEINNFIIDIMKNIDEESMISILADITLNKK